MGLHIYPATIRGVDPPISCLLSRPKPEFRTAPTVVYFHGLNGTRNQIFQDRFLAFAEMVKEIGCNLLSAELRAHGDRREDREKTAMENFVRGLRNKENNPFAGALADIRRIMEFIAEKKIAPPGRVAVCGMSWGALHAMYAMKIARSLRCGLALLPVGRIGAMMEFRKLAETPLIQKYEPLNFLRGLAPAPLLMLTAERDQRVDCRHAGELYERLLEEYEAAGAANRLVYKMLLGAGHAYDPRMTGYAREWFENFLLDGGE